MFTIVEKQKNILSDISKEPSLNIISKIAFTKSLYEVWMVYLLTAYIKGFRSCGIILVFLVHPGPKT
jgi:hypothetical protein